MHGWTIHTHTQREGGEREREGKKERGKRREKEGEGRREREGGRGKEAEGRRERGRGQELIFMYFFGYYLV